LIVLPMNFLDVYDSLIETAKFDSINHDPIKLRPLKIRLNLT